MAYYKKFLTRLIFLTLFVSCFSYAQSIDYKGFCSHLPIVAVTFTGNDKSFPEVKLDTAESRLASKAKRTVNLKIFDQNPRDAATGNINCVSHQGVKIEATMHYRGSSSLGFPKRQYGVKLAKAWNLQSSPSLLTPNFLGMPYGGKTWIFSAEQANLDATYLRNTLSFHLQNEFGKLMHTNKAWGPRTRFFELFIDKKYAGLYNVAEAIEFADNRVHPQAILERYPPSLLYKIDQPSPKECDIPISDSTTNEKFVVYDYQKVTPIIMGGNKCKKALPEFWPNAFSLWTEAVKSSHPQTKKLIINGHSYDTLIETDDDSFAISFLLNEFIKDPDGYNRNTFFYQTFTQHPARLTLFAGPLWDKNLGYDLYLSPDVFPVTGGYMPPIDSIYRYADGWTFSVKYNFWKEAFKRPSVQNKICFYWNRAKSNGILTEQGVNLFLDQKVNWISRSVNSSTPIERDCTRYFPNSPCASQYPAKMALLKTYVKDRLAWMNDNLGATEADCRAKVQDIFANPSPPIRMKKIQK